MKKRFLLPLILAGAAVCSTASNADTQSFTPDQQTQIQKIVHDYLVNNPQVLVEVANALQSQQLAQQNEQAMKALPANAKELFYDPNSPVAGNPNGNITVVEFFDYQCPHCKNVTPEINKLVSSDNNVRVVFKQLPIFGSNSEFAARAALAANQQGKYLELHNALMNAQGALSHEAVLTIASNVGLDIQKLQNAMSSQAITQELKVNFKLANAFNFPGTPAFVIAKVPVGNAANNAQPPSNAYFIPGEASESDLQKYVNKAKNS